MTSLCARGSTVGTVSKITKRVATNPAVCVPTVAAFATARAALATKLWSA